MSKFPYATVWRLAGPNIASNMMAVSTMLVHLWIVGPLGAEASAAVIAMTRINFLMMAAAMALSVATTALVARAWGAEDKTEANRAATSALGMAFIIAVIIALPVLIFPGAIAGIFTDKVETQNLITDMLRPTAFLTMLFALSITLSTNYRAVGNVIRPLKIIFVASTGNIILAYVFTTGAFGMTAMGPIGIPIGALTAQVVVTSFYIWVWSRGNHEIKPDWGYLINKIRYKKLFIIGLPAALEQYVFQAGSIIIMMLLVNYGTEAFVAYGIGVNILSVCFVIGMGFGSAGSILAGQRLGAGNIPAARESSGTTLKLAMACMGSLALVIGLFRHQLVSVFTIDPIVIYNAEVFVLILALCQPFIAIEFATGGTLRGAGDTRFPMMASMVGTIFSRIILAYLTVYMGWPVEIMYGLIMIDFIIKASALTWRFKGEAWTKTLDHTPPEPLQSLHSINSTGVREYYKTHPDDDTVQYSTETDTESK